MNCMAPVYIPQCDLEISVLRKRTSYTERWCVSSTWTPTYSPVDWACTYARVMLPLGKPQRQRYPRPQVLKVVGSQPPPAQSHTFVLYRGLLQGSFGNNQSIHQYPIPDVFNNKDVLWKACQQEREGFNCTRQAQRPRKRGLLPLKRDKQRVMEYCFVLARGFIPICCSIQPLWHSKPSPSRNRTILENLLKPEC